MSFKLLLNQLPQLEVLPANIHLLLENRLIYREFQRGQHLLRPDEFCKHIHFIIAGFVRSYCLNEGTEQTTGFASKTQLFTSVTSFFMQKRSPEGIICETPVQVWSLSYHDLRSLEELSADFLQASKRIIEERLMHLHTNLAIYRLNNATAQFLHLCNEHPQIESMVSQKHIASYLGITEQSMSVIRKNLLRNI